MYLNIFGLIVFIFLLGAQIWRSFCDRVIANNANFKQNNANRIFALFASYSHYSRTLSKFIFLFAVIIVFALLFYQSYLQYQTWFSDEFSKHLLYQETSFALPFSVNYFVFYVGTRFFAPYLISLVAGLFFLFFAQKLNKKYNERFFEPEEPWFGVLSFFLLGHPGWLFYFVILILLYLIIQLINISVYPRIHQRTSAYWLWLPTAIFVILISKWLQSLLLWKLLIF